MLTVVGIQLPYLIGGAVIIEQIFSLPASPLHAGVDRGREYTLVSGINLLTATLCAAEHADPGEPLRGLNHF